MNGNASTCADACRRALTLSVCGLGLWILPTAHAQDCATLCFQFDPLAESDSAGPAERNTNALPHGASPEGGGDLSLLLRNPSWPANTEHVLVRTSGGYLTADDFQFAHSTPLVAVRMFYGDDTFATDPSDAGSDFFLRIWNDDGTGTGPISPPVFSSGPHNLGDGVLSIDLFDTDPFGTGAILGAMFNFSSEFFVAEPETKYWIGMTAQPPSGQSCIGVTTSNIPNTSFEPMVQASEAPWSPVCVGNPPQYADMAMELFGFTQDGGVTVLALSSESEGGCTVRITPTTTLTTNCGGDCNTDLLFGSDCYAEVTLDAGLGSEETAFALAVGLQNAPGCDHSIISAWPTAANQGPRLVVTTTAGAPPKLCLSINSQPRGILGGPNECMSNGCGYHFQIGHDACDSPTIRPGFDTFATPPEDCSLHPQEDSGTWVRINVPGAMFDLPGLLPANSINERVRLRGVARDFAPEDSDMEVVRMDTFTFGGCAGDFSRPDSPPTVFSPDGVIDVHDIDAFVACNGQTSPFEGDCGFFDYNGDSVINGEDSVVLLCLQASADSVECCPCDVSLPMPADNAVPTFLTRRHLRGCEYLDITRDGMPWPEKWVVDYYLSTHEPSPGTNDVGICEPRDDKGPDGNDVLATADNLGLITEGHPLQIGGTIGNRQGCDIAPFWPGDHDADVYRFTLGFDADVLLRADGLINVDCQCDSGHNSTTSLWLYDHRGSLLDSHTPAGSSDPAIHIQLQSGEYYILIAAAGQIAAPQPNGLPGNPLCSIAFAPEIDGGSTNPTGCYDLHLALLPRSEMSVVQETGIGGSFASRLLVQPLISFQEVADPFHAVVIDTGDIGTDATILEATGHYVTSLNNNSDVIPGDENFIPGVRGDGEDQTIELIQYEDTALNLAGHRVTPARNRPCDPLPGGGDFEVQLPDDVAVGTWRIDDGVTIITGDSKDCLFSGSIASGAGYRLDPQMCIINGFQSIEGDSHSDGLRWSNIGAPWESFDELDAGGATQAELVALFSQLSGVTAQEVTCLTENIPAGLTIDAVFDGVAAFNGSELTGELHRLCNGAVVEIVDPEDALSQNLHILGVRWTSGAATLITVAGPLARPSILCGSGDEGETQPCCGYIDPRDPFGDGSDSGFGLTEALIRFDRPVFKCDGSDVDASAFTITETGGGTPPAVTSATYVGGDQGYVEVAWDRPITLQEWTTILASDICNADGLPITNNGDLGPGASEPDRIDFGFLPGDLDQSSCVSPFDLLMFRQIINHAVTPECPRLDFIDINRNGGSDPFDLLVFRQLINGVGPPPTQPWAGECMNNPQP